MMQSPSPCFRPGDKSSGARPLRKLTEAPLSRPRTHLSAVCTVLWCAFSVAFFANTPKTSADLMPPPGTPAFQSISTGVNGGDGGFTSENGVAVWQYDGAGSWTIFSSAYDACACPGARWGRG